MQEATSHIVLPTAVPRISASWEHSLSALLGHEPCTDNSRALRLWVVYHDLSEHLDFLHWDPEELKSDSPLTIYDDNSDGEI